MLLFLAFFVRLRSRCRSPLHTWLPDAHVEAPTAGSNHSGRRAAEMGIYGMIRFCCPLFPRLRTARLPTSRCWQSSVLLRPLVALVQPNLKKL